MPKAFFRKLSPDHKKLKEHKYLRIFGRLLHDPNLFHLNRRSVSGAMFCGLLCAFIPIFPQMLTSAILAIIFRVNLPISVSLVWLTNPITIPPMFYGSYRVGLWVLGQESKIAEFQMNMAWLESVLGDIFWPLFVGGIIVGTVFGVLGMIGTRLLWRWHVISHLKRRRAARQQRKTEA